LGYKASGSRDFGHFSSGPLKGAKGTIHEGGHRVPFIMRWNNGAVPKGETRFGLNDLFATLCKLAGVDVPEDQAIDSVSFADYIADENKTDNLREFLGVWATKGGVIRDESIRKHNLKLIRQRETGNLFLYDLGTDLSETQNLINQSKHRDTVYEMMDKLKEISPCYDNKNTFQIVGSSGGEEEVTCDWFRQKPWRCDAYPKGKIECRLACTGRNFKFCSLMAAPSTLSPTVSSPPTDSPTSPSKAQMPVPTCADSTERFTTIKNGESIRQSCDWVLNRDTKNRCKLLHVSSTCPDTCGTCSNVPMPTSSPISTLSPVPTPTSNPDIPPPTQPETCVDSTERFKTIKDGESIRRTCDWVSNRDTENRCKLLNVSTICPNTCGTCSLNSGDIPIRS